MQVLLYLLCCYILSSPIVFPYTLLRFFCDMLSPIPTKRFSVLRFCLYTSYQDQFCVFVFIRHTKARPRAKLCPRGPLNA